ncbi:MAG TPA: rhomboid family intramembrane serine protease [Chitinophagaceae bacterium]|nr:rhomboid family intramembrane serine protease [Chitinophagaceae bacterium]
MSVLQDKRRSKRVFLGQDGNALVSLVAINVILFAILKFLFLVYKVTELNADAYYRSVFNWFILPADLSTFAGRPWVLLTYMFTHESVFHLIGNMLWLWVFGYILQDMTGNRKLAPIYIYGGVTGAFFYIVSYHVFPQLQSALPAAAFLGANAAVMAVAVATTTLTPDYRIFPMINGGLPLWILTLVYIVIDIASIPAGDPGKYIAHLSGAGIGALFIYQMRKGNDWGKWMNRFSDWAINLFNPDKKKKNTAKDDFFYKVKGQPYTKTPNITQERIDKVLDKINQQGYHKLTNEEKDILRRAANDGDL